MKIIKELISKRIIATIIIIVILMSSELVIFAQKSEIDQSIESLRYGLIIIKANPLTKVSVEQLSHEFWFGCSIPDIIFNGSATESDISQFKEKFLENFNSAVTEGAMKWANMESKKGKVNYLVIDSILSWTEANHIPIRGHNIFWGIPIKIQPWLKEMSNVELEQTLKNRAETLTARYKGRFYEYDLNNEMVHGNYYEDRLGSDITKKMSNWVLTSDPEIKLFLNDYDILTGVKLTEYMTQIRKLIKQDVPIAGIGVQGHLHGEAFDRVQLKNSLDSLAKFHLPIRITEFNMPGQRSKYFKDHSLVMTPKDEELKAKELVDFYKICFAHPYVEGILMWGFWEGNNWIPASSLYKKDWTATSASIAYHKLIYKKWWTNEDGQTNCKGEFLVTAFYGKYKVTINGKTKEFYLTKASGKVVLEF